MATITEEEVRAAQKIWGTAVVNVGQGEGPATATLRARQWVEKLYVTDGSLLFCPTLASEQQFRRTVKASVSYFVGGDEEFPEDIGFALRPWSKVRFENAGIEVRGETAMAMGNYFFTGPDGVELKVEFTFVYVRDRDGDLRIQVHHSALPYSGSLAPPVSSGSVRMSPTEG